MISIWKSAKKRQQQQNIEFLNVDINKPWYMQLEVNWFSDFNRKPIAVE